MINRNRSRVPQLISKILVYLVVSLYWFILAPERRGSKVLFVCSYCSRYMAKIEIQKAKKELNSLGLSYRPLAIQCPSKDLRLGTLECHGPGPWYGSKSPASVGMIWRKVIDRICVILTGAGYCLSTVCYACFSFGHEGDNWRWRQSGRSILPSGEHLSFQFLVVCICCWWTSIWLDVCTSLYLDGRWHIQPKDACSVSVRGSWNIVNLETGEIWQIISFQLRVLGSG